MNDTRSRIPVLLLLGALGSTMFLGDIDVGPFSPRVYLYGLLLLWAAWRLVIAGDALPIDRDLVPVILTYGAVFLWMFGAMLLQRSSFAAIGRWGVDQVFALGTFFLALLVIRTRRDVNLLLAGMVALLLLSGVFALLQWRGNPYVWTLWHRLRPHIIPSPEGWGYFHTAEGPRRLGLSGLFASTVTFGYYVAVLLPVVLRRFLARRSLLTLLALCLTFVTVLAVQQRSVVVAAALAIGAILLVQMGSGGQRVKVLFAMVAVAAVLLGIYRTVTAQEEAVGNRFHRMVDVGRLQVARVALRSTFENPLVGSVAGYVRLYEREQPEGYDEVVAPHNIFLNAAIYYGIPGLLLTCVFLAALAYYLVRTWLAARARNDWTSITLVLSMLCYVLNAQFHNASFITGDVLPWVILAALAAAIREPRALPVPRAARYDARRFHYSVQRIR